jgi:hypothetical protein
MQARVVLEAKIETADLETQIVYAQEDHQAPLVVLIQIET